MRLRFLIAFLSFFISSSTLALYDIEHFSTTEKANKYCPAIDSIKYQNGKFSAEKRGVQFQGHILPRSDSVPEPATVTKQGKLESVQVRRKYGLYGHRATSRGKITETVTCFYSYPDKNANKVRLIMCGTRQSSE